MNSKRKLLQSFVWWQAKRFIRWIAPITLVSICLLAITNISTTSSRAAQPLLTDNRAFQPFSTVSGDAKSLSNRADKMLASFEEIMAKVVAEIDSIKIAYLKTVKIDYKVSSPATAK